MIDKIGSFLEQMRTYRNEGKKALVINDDHFHDFLSDTPAEYRFCNHRLHELGVLHLVFGGFAVVAKSDEEKLPFKSCEISHGAY